MCPKCGFTADVDEFDKPEGMDKAKVRQALAQVKAPRLFEEVERAVAVEKAWRNRKGRLRQLSLAGKRPGRC